MKQTCQFFDHQEYVNHCKQQEEILEDCFYSHQGKERVDFLCHSLDQLASNNDHINEHEYTIFENQLEK